MAPFSVAGAIGGGGHPAKDHPAASCNIRVLGDFSSFIGRDAKMIMKSMKFTASFVANSAGRQHRTIGSDL